MWCVVLLAAIGQVNIDAPALPVGTGQAAQFFVEGIGDESLPQARVVHYPRDGVTCWAARGWEGRPFVFFQSEKPGRYLLAVFAPSPQVGGKPSYAEIEFEVVGNPTPAPGPQELSVVLVHETLARPGPLVIEVLKLQKYLATKDYFSRIADPDQLDGMTGKPPAWLPAPGGKLPRVYVGDVSADFTTAAKAIAFIEATHAN